jgi:cytochrome P450
MTVSPRPASLRSFPLHHLWLMKRDPLTLFGRAQALGAPVVRVPMGPMSVHALCSEEAVRAVLVDHPDRWIKGTRGARLLRASLGDSVLTTDGADWKARRRVAQPAFRRAAIAQLGDRMGAAADDLVARLADAPGPVGTSSTMMDLTLRIACDTLFGTDLGTRREDVHAGLDGLLANFLTLLVVPWPEPHKAPFPSAYRYRTSAAKLGALVDGLIAERRARGGASDDLLGMLLEASASDDAPQPVDAWLRSEVVTMLLAGHETTANALTWTLAYHAHHPEWMARAAAEARALGRTPTAGDVRSMPVIEAVLRESMRLRPPAWIVARSAIEDEEVAGAHIPAGGFVFMCVAAHQRDPLRWTDPDTFDPGRWGPGVAEEATRSLRWMPFGAGQRKCIGEHFAMMEALIVLGALLRAYDVSPTGPMPEPDPSVTLRPKGDAPLRFTPA